MEVLYGVEGDIHVRLVYEDVLGGPTFLYGDSSLDSIDDAS